MVLIAVTVHEFLKFCYYKRLYRKTYEFLSLQNNSERKDYMNRDIYFRIVTIGDVTEWLMLIAGLFTTDCIAYLSIIFLSLSKFQYIGPWALRMDSLMTTSIYVVIILNKIIAYIS